MTTATRSTSLASLMALLVGVGLLVFGTNLQGVLLPLVGHERGSGMVAIGLFSAGWSAGFVFACLCIGNLLGRIGQLRCFLLLASVSAGCTLLLSALPHDPAWIALRVLIGFCYGGLSTIVEGWLVEQAGGSSAFTSYMIVNLLASLLGTLSLNLVNPLGRIPFTLTAVAIALSMLPVMLSQVSGSQVSGSSRMAEPAISPLSRPRPGRLLRASPVAAVGCVVVGSITGAIGGLGPVFGMMSGLTMRQDTLMLAANSIGGALAYAPVGMLAARIDRRALVLGITLLGIAVCAPLILWPDLSPWAVILMLGAFGFVQYPLYGLCVGIACARLPDQPGPQTISELLLLFGFGTIAGPLVGGQIMRGGSIHLFSFVAASLAILATVIIIDRLRAVRPSSSAVTAAKP